MSCRIDELIIATTGAAVHVLEEFAPWTRNGGFYCQAINVRCSHLYHIISVNKSINQCIYRNEVQYDS